MNQFNRTVKPIDQFNLTHQYRIAESFANYTAQSGLFQRITSSKKYQAIRHALPKREKRLAMPQHSALPPQMSDAAADLVTNLPGMTFNLSSQMYSGYLGLTNSTLGNFSGIYLHYWLITSEVNPNDPLILWLNGGPGCSSLGGLLNELGPLRPSKDGKWLYQNPYAWTKAGNVLFLESPRGVGFSYAPNSSIPLNENNDDLTARMNTDALIQFYARFPQYNNRRFFITGESYGGVYVPTLTDRLIKTIKERNLQSTINLQGIAIGNGELSELKQISSAVTLNYFKGFYDYPTYVNVSACCPGNTAADGAYSVPCDLTQYVSIDAFGNVVGKMGMQLITLF